MFSFGVIIYELSARKLLFYSHLGKDEGPPGAKTPADYAAAVARGYRPERPEEASDVLWELIEACW